VRGITLGISRREFVDAARLSGASHSTIVLTEVLPNVLPVIVVTMSTTVGWMILETAGLSFLGLGAQPPQADLGSMLGEARSLLFTAPFVSVIPGLMIFALVMSINLVGDGVRDVLDPRLRSGALAAPGAVTAVERDHAPAAETPGAVLDVVDLSTEFRTGTRVHHAVGGVSLALAPGERVGLVGESGSGKSVTALSLMRLVPTPPGVITAGRVGVEGKDQLAAPLAELRRLRGGPVAYVFQDPLGTLHPLFRVGDQIVETIRAHQPLSHREARERAVGLMDAVRIPGARARLDAYPHELSGGMRQRVCIAMALANEPDLVIADEPTTALDVTVQAQILTLLRHLSAEKGSAVLFITHDFGVVSELCDRVAVMYAGRIVELGPTEAVLSRPAHPYTRRLIHCVPVLGEPDRPLEPIEGAPPPVDRLPPGCAFAPRCDRATAACREGDVTLDPRGEGRAVRCIHPLEDA
jgi:peptide/nickel transport system permease protein